MRALALFLAFATQLAAMALAAEDFTSAEPQQARDIDIAAIDAYLETAMAVAHIPGLALGIVQNDRIVHLRGFGTADPTGRPVTPQTPFILGSVSKSFTALAVTQLIEARYARAALLALVSGRRCFSLIADHGWSPPQSYQWSFAVGQLRNAGVWWF